jgi:hypothetical protein
MHCPFCLVEKEADAPVCPTCSRDTEVPLALRKEHADLLTMRDRLRAELVKKEGELSVGKFILKRSRNADDLK